MPHDDCLGRVAMLRHMALRTPAMHDHCSAQAVAVMRAALEQQGPDPELLLEWAMLSEWATHPELHIAGSRDALHQALLLGPEPSLRAELHLQLSNIYEIEDMPHEAERHARLALDTDPDQPECTVALARLLARRGAPQQALELLSPPLCRCPMDAEIVRMRRALAEGEIP